MGGGGSYYDRDVTDKSRRTSRGFSDVAEEKMSRSRVDEAVLPKDRRLACEAKSPIVYAFDVTGSMGDLPKIIFDKMPMMAGQLIELGYLEDPMISIAAVGDIFSDRAPIQIGDFSTVKKLDTWLQRIWLEGNGGGQGRESYEMTAYFYAQMCELPEAVTPVFLFTGDEGFYEELLASDLRKHFGNEGEYRNIDARDIFDELKKKFKGNVFLIHRRYGSGDAEIVKQWEGALGKEKVVKLGSDLAIADVTLGVFALVSGMRTLDEYCQDMKTRGQTQERITEVKNSLECLAEYLESQKKFSDVPKGKKTAAKAESSSAKSSGKASDKNSTAAKSKKAGRL